MEVPCHNNSSSDVVSSANSVDVTAGTSGGATSHVRNDPSPAGQITQTFAEPGRQEDVVIRPEPAHKSVAGAYVLCILLGLFGAHHFYLRRNAFGVFYVFTLGMLGCGWIVDLFRIPQLVRNANKKMDHPHEFEPRTISDAYILSFPLGFLGKCGCTKSAIWPSPNWQFGALQRFSVIELYVGICLYCLLYVGLD